MKLSDLTLDSHYLCPYVQRAVIVASEKGIALDRTMIDLAAKPDWFLAQRGLAHLQVGPFSSFVQP